MRPLYESPNPDAKYRINAEPGVIEQLPPGTKFTSWSPDHPASAFPGLREGLAPLRFLIAGRVL